MYLLRYVTWLRLERKKTAASAATGVEGSDANKPRNPGEFLEKTAPVTAKPASAIGKIHTCSEILSRKRVSMGRGCWKISPKMPEGGAVGGISQPFQVGENQDKVRDWARTFYGCRTGASRPTARARAGLPLAGGCESGGR